MATVYEIKIELVSDWVAYDEEHIKKLIQDNKNLTGGVRVSEINVDIKGRV